MVGSGGVCEGEREGGREGGREEGGKEGKRAERYQRLCVLLLGNLGKATCSGVLCCPPHPSWNVHTALTWLAALVDSHSPPCVTAW